MDKLILPVKSWHHEGPDAFVDTNFSDGSSAVAYLEGDPDNIVGVQNVYGDFIHHSGVEEVDNQTRARHVARMILTHFEATGEIPEWFNGVKLPAKAYN